MIEVEQPAARFRPDGRRLTTSYLNFYLATGAVVLPMFGDPMDDAAFKAISGAFPDRQAIQLDASDLVYGGGGIHCITQQQPAPRLVEGVGRGPPARTASTLSRQRKPMALRVSTVALPRCGRRKQLRRVR